jgi:hypothetical protein
MRKKESLFNEDEVIDLIFENDKKIKNKKIYKLEEAITPRILAYAGKKTKQVAKDVGKGLLNFAIFNMICRTITERLNKTWGLKRATGDVVKDIYQKALIVLSFFYKSKYKLILIRGFSKYYSWDLAMAIIFVYEGFKNDNGITYGIRSAYKITPDIMKQKIDDFYTKIMNKRVTLNMLTLDIDDKDAAADKSREIGGKFGDTGVDINSLVSWYKTKLNSMAGGPLDMIRDIGRFKLSKTPKVETLNYLTALESALVEVNKIWPNKLNSAEINTVRDAIEKNLSTVQFKKPQDIKDDTGKILNISASRGIVSINTLFTLEKIQPPNDKILKAKIIFCLVLRELKASPLNLRVTQEIVSRVDFLSKPI